MQTTSGQQSFFGLFDQAGTAATALKVSSKPSEPKPESTEFSFVTKRQREVMRSNPYAPFLRDKSIDEIRELEKTIGTDLWKKSQKNAAAARQLEAWRTAYASALTIAVEKEYKAVDERFCKPEKGIFYLVGKDGQEQLIAYKYTPSNFDMRDERTGFPIHHLEYNSGKVPTEISETGYRSHFFGNVPVAHVKDFADFMVQTLRIAHKVKGTIIFEGQRYEFDASMLPAEKPKKKKCPECNSKMKDDECLNCGFFDGDDEDFDDEFED